MSPIGRAHSIACNERLSADRLSSVQVIPSTELFFMVDSVATSATLDEFFRRWEASGAAERANYSMFLNESVRPSRSPPSRPGRARRREERVVIIELAEDRCPGFPPI